MDHAAQLRVRIHRIAKADGFGFFQHERHKFIRHALLHQDPLNCRAALAGIARGTGHRNRRGFFQICIREII